MWRKNLLATVAIVTTATGWVLFLSGCGGESRGDPQLSPVSPRSAAVLAMMNFSHAIAALDPEEREKLTSIQQLYKRFGGRPDWSEFRSWSHVEWEAVGRPGFDYVVHTNRAGVPDDEAILIATPCEIRIKDGESARVALTHALKVIQIKDPEYHQRVYEQSE